MSVSRLSGPRPAHRPGSWQVASVVGIDDESALVRRACAGDQRAFTDLIAADRAAVWAVCLRTTGNRTDAEDALQDTLLAAWRNMAKFRSDARFSTWLFRIAANAALAVVRRRPEIVTDFDVLALGRDPGDQVADADRVQTALMTLPETFRVALVLRIYGDLSYEDIAVHQGIPVQTVKSRLWRARAMLHELLAPTSDTDQSPRVPIISD
jgi:RNA polymerase sigma factor (sigma-70 family)